MGILRPATPGFLVTTLATVLLLVVSFSVPWFKSVYFLKAQVNQSGQSGYITFGVLGYCTSLNGGSVNCTSAKLGYEFDPNALLGDNIKFLQIPTVVVKWITWALVLHIVAFGLAAIAALFGLLAHIREFAMTCFSSCISGIAAVVALFAFIFDLVLFFTTKSRINDVKGGSAVIGNAVWLTLVSWMLLFFSGCFYTIGRCCITRRPRGPNNDKWKGGNESGSTGNQNSYSELMRLDAVKAEADRKARQAAGERGLPAFPTLDEHKPLSANYEATYLEEEEPVSPYRDSAPTAGRPAGPRSPRRQGTGRSDYSDLAGAAGLGASAAAAAAASGYTPGQYGHRTVDQYDNAQPGYPPQTTPSRVSQRQANTSPAPLHEQNYSTTQPGNYYNNQPQTSVDQYRTTSPGQYNDPYSSNHQGGYGTAAVAAGVAAAGGAYAAQKRYSRDASYDNYQQPSQSHLAAPSGYAPGHGQDQTTYHSSYSHPQDHSQVNQDSYTSDPYMTMPNPHDEANPQYLGSAYPSSNALPNSHQPTPYYTPPTGGSAGYNANQPAQYEPRPQSSGTSYFPYGGQQEQPGFTHHNSASPGGLPPVREASGSSSEHPPGYSQGAYVPGAWAGKS